MNTIDQLRSGQLLGAQKLSLSCNLTSFPEEIYQLADTLEYLDLSGNQLTALPDDFVRLTKLKILFCSNNPFTVFPEVLGQCTQLDIIGFKANKIMHVAENALPPNIRWLILTNNRLPAIPETIGNCKNLQKLMLAGNLLTHLPDTLAACKNLELLRISANKLELLPEWINTMPRLAWLAFAGNPYSTRTEHVAPPAVIPWKELLVQEQLGEGASGIISRATWNGKDGSKEVAVKIFKGEVTSDGLPGDEMDASMAVGAHPNLVQVLGKIEAHPQQKQGLVFELIPASFRNLGDPPSFESCTRDTFPEGTFFTASQIFKIACSVADAAAHLHARGILHGDLYAHNTLVDEAANTLFGDFGGAAIYNKNGTHARALEQLEVRAFGCLIDDLLMHCSVRAANEKPVINFLENLCEACVNPVVQERPVFAKIVSLFQENSMS